MVDTVEMRWFFDSPPLDLSRELHDPTEHQQRTDWYNMPGNPRCSIKLREGRLEAKLRTASLGPRQLAPLEGYLEAWRKWSLDFPDAAVPTPSELNAANWIAVHKQRALKRFEVDGPRVKAALTRPNNGCEFEMTQLSIGNQTYWTVGFEAVGPPGSLEANLRRVVQHVTAEGGLELRFDCTNSFSYAQWLAELPPSGR
jgi:hypothetical protein